MRRFLLVATAATLAYCLVDAVAHNGGEAAGHAGAPTFSAEIASVPADGVLGFGRTDAAAALASAATAASHAAMAGTDQANSSAEKPSIGPAITAPPRVHAAAVAPRAASRHAPRPDRIAPTQFAAPAPVHVAPTWEPPMQPIMVAQRGSVASGCSGAKWSQPDAAGVPVLVCN